MSEPLDLNKIESGKQIETVLAVKDKQGVQSYQNGSFFTIRLGNKKGEIDAKYWGNEEEKVQKLHDQFSVGDIVKIKGKIRDYKGTSEIAINPDNQHYIKKEVQEKYDPTDFLETIQNNPEHLFSEISKKIRDMENEHLKNLCMKFYGNKDIAPELKKLPAAKSYHHNKIGGYIEHIHETTQLAETFCRQYSSIDRELLLTGVFLHDIGKIKEYDYGAGIDFTDQGRLIGHIPLGDQMITSAMEEMEDFPEELEQKVRHLILSHHGKKEWGSAVEPRIKEAIILHEIEYLDSKVSKVMETFRKHSDSEESGIFAPELNQYIYLK